MLASLILGCSPSSYLRTINTLSGYDASAGLDELKQLCEKDAGLTIHKTVEAEGYYDADRSYGAIRNLVESDYSFIEYCDLESNFQSLFNEPGCWRLTKASRFENNCNEAVDKVLYRYSGSSYPEFRENNCIAAEKIKKPTARYSYHSELKKWADEDPILKFRRSHAYIKDTNTDEVLGRYVSYSYYNEKSLNKISKSCQILEGDYLSYREANLINTVLNPISNEVDHY